MSDHPHWHQNLERQIPGLTQALNAFQAQLANSGYHLTSLTLRPAHPHDSSPSPPPNVTILPQMTTTPTPPHTPTPPRTTTATTLTTATLATPTSTAPKRASTSLLQTAHAPGKRKRFSEPSPVAARADPFWGTVLEERPGTPQPTTNPSRLAAIQSSPQQQQQPQQPQQPHPHPPPPPPPLPPPQAERSVFRTSTLPALPFRSPLTLREPFPTAPSARPDLYRDHHDKGFLRRTGQLLGRLSPFGASAATTPLRAPLSPPPLNVEAQMYRDVPFNTSTLRRLPSPPKTPVSDILTHTRIPDSSHLFPAVSTHQTPIHTPASAFFHPSIHQPQQPQSGSRSASGSGVSYAQPSRSSPQPRLPMDRSSVEPVRDPLRAKRGRKIKTPLDREQFFECDKCNSKFRRKSDKNRHVRVVHEKSRPFVCPMCEKTFGEKSNMLKHRASVHDDVRTFRCPYCDLTFSQRGLCDSHVRNIHGQKQAKYFCEHCGLPFSRKIQLKEHYEQVHPQFGSTYRDSSLAGPSSLPGRSSSQPIREEGAMVGDTNRPIGIASVSMSPFPRLQAIGPSEGRTIPSTTWTPYPSSLSRQQAPAAEYEQIEEEDSSRARSLQGDSSG